MALSATTENFFTELIKDIHQLNNIKKLTDVQKKAYPFINTQENLVIVSPSGTGKTLIAEIIALKDILEHESITSRSEVENELSVFQYHKLKQKKSRAKTIFLVPLRALADEKAKIFANNYKDYKLKVHLSMSEVDFAEEEILDCDILISTYERFKVILGRIPNFAQYISNVVIDEFHLLGDKSRGSNLEVIISLLKDKVRFILLSATVANPQEVADWLQAKLIISKKRRIPLEYQIKVSLDPIKELKKIINTNLEKNNQVLVFCGTRKKAESIAKELADYISRKSQEKEDFDPKKIENFLKSIPLPRDTIGNGLIYELTKKGTAFHHAGLSSLTKKVVEELFRKNEIKILFCTETLGAGINLPVREVVLLDTKRWNNEWLSRNTFHQIAGRAGRLGYDSYGRCTIFASDNRERKAIQKRFWKANKTEAIASDNMQYLSFETINTTITTIAEMEKLVLNLIHSHKPNYNELLNLLLNGFHSKIMEDDHTAIFCESFFDLMLRTREIDYENKMNILEKKYPNTNFTICNIFENKESQTIEIVDDKNTVFYIRVTTNNFTCNCSTNTVCCAHRIFVLKQLPIRMADTIINDKFSILDSLLKYDFIQEKTNGTFFPTSKGIIWAEMGITREKFIHLREWLLLDLFTKNNRLHILLNECLKKLATIESDGIMIDNTHFRRPIFEHIIHRKELPRVIAKYQLYEGDLLRIEVSLKSFLSSIIPLAEFLGLDQVKTNLEKLDLLLADAMFRH